ncbi:hypothetical protein MOB74_08565 [Bacillus paralicheniformis]|uniref:hypothetical protein n=1 Tax=Bacillus paralicheniformis TaxID=1648923 RepID=UPI00227E6315|nr:hypothetical protein [Bacillus paralicheniformis]MCY8038108.1 hypothetical protein [Bacillus paralicheniformis]
MYPNRYPYTPAPGYTPEDVYGSYQPAVHHEQRIYEPYEGQIITAPANTRFWRRGTEVFLHSSTFDPSGREMLYVVYPIRRQHLQPPGSRDLCERIQRHRDPKT